MTRERRNGGRVLGVVIESGDVRSRAGLQALSEVTRETFRSRGLDVSAWPLDARTALEGIGAVSRFVKSDAHGEQHVFALVDCGAFDLLFGVSSRREVNTPGNRSGNVATNVLLDVLALTEPGAGGLPRYGQVGAEDLSRVWRSDVGAAHVQAFAKDWDLILWSRSDYLDYLIPGTSLMGTVKGNQAAEQATAVVVNGSKHKAVAHAQGKLKYARGQTHPLIKVHPITEQILGYDEAVVSALREALTLLRNGASWDEAVTAVGGRIPATQAQQEPDEDHGGGRSRTRAGRNKLRVARGLPELPFRFLADGTPNPDYRPETILDLNHSGQRLKDLLIWGATVPARHAASIKSRVDADLDGLAPEDAFHELYTRGVYRRLVKDQSLSNNSVVRFKWASFDLGPTADGQFVLSSDDVEMLRGFRTGKAGTGSWGNNPLTGVFRVHQPTDLYSRSGWLRHDIGKFVARSGSTGNERGLRIWFEPTGSGPHSADCRALGWVPNSEIGPEIARMLVAAVTGTHDLAEFRFDHPTFREDPVVTAKQAIADLERRHEVTARRLTDPELSDMTLSALKRELASVERQLDESALSLERAIAAATAMPETHDDEFDITDLAQLAAVLSAAVPVPPRVAERAARLLRNLLHDPRLTLDPATGSIRIDATLMLQSDRGMLSIPLRGTVPNHTTDPWVGGLAGQWWEQRRAPFATLMTHRGLATKPGSATRWHQVIAARLLEHAEEQGRKLRGPTLAALLVRCDDPDALEQIRTAIDTGSGSEALRAFLFDGPDTGFRQPWRTAGQALLTPSAGIDGMS